MASSSSLPRSGNAMVSLSRVRACIFRELFVGTIAFVTSRKSPEVFLKWKKRICDSLICCVMLFRGGVFMVGLV